MSDFRGRQLAALQAKIAALESGARSEAGRLPFGAPEIDACLPGGGLPLGCWHEVAGEGMEAETCAAPAAFTALVAAPLAGRGEAVWIMRRDDLWAPGLAGLGFPANRLICVCARDDADVLSVAEDALATAGVACVVAEVEDVDLTAGRRLQLACERRGSTGFVLRRRPYGGGARGATAGSAAATRWRVASAPSETVAGLYLGPPRFRAVLERCRGGRSGAWILEASAAYGPIPGPTPCEEGGDVAHPLRLVAPVGDRQLAPATPRISHAA